MKLLFVAAVVTACAQGTLVRGLEEEPAATAASTSQSLFSRWQQENTTTVIDLTGGNLRSEFYFKFLPAKGGTCQCLLDLRGGTQEGGAATMSDCEYQDGSASPNADPGCQTLDGTYAYASNGTSLSFTNVSTNVTTTFRAGGGQDAAAVLAR